mgnify:CR=1 FL=1
MDGGWRGLVTFLTLTIALLLTATGAFAFGPGSFGATSGRGYAIGPCAGAIVPGPIVPTPTVPAVSTVPGAYGQGLTIRFSSEVFRSHMITPVLPHVFPMAMIRPVWLESFPAPATAACVNSFAHPSFSNRVVWR